MKYDPIQPHLRPTERESPQRQAYLSQQMQTMLQNKGGEASLGLELRFTMGDQD